jgi:hypothetical protein
MSIIYIFAYRGVEVRIVYSSPLLSDVIALIAGYPN